LTPRGAGRIVGVMSEAAATRTERGSKVLLVLNDLFFEAKIGEVLRTLGVPFAIARSNEQFAKRLEEDDPALAIVDLGARGIEPFLAIQYVRTDERWQRLPVVSFGAHVVREQHEEARSLGVSEAVAKSKLDRFLPDIVRRHAPHLLTKK